MLKTIIYIILIIIFLIYPEATFNYASSGLYNWATRIVPTLFPFMMISSLMAMSGADYELGSLLGKIFKKIYHFSNYGLYAIFMGFFCGFPMGAKVVSELYGQGKITAKEANALLAFCNNIGPGYFAGIIIPIIQALGYTNTLPFIFGMYGIPAIYGIIIGLATRHKNNTLEQTQTPQGNTKAPLSLMNSIKMSCSENTQSIIILGGYITFTNAIRIILDLIPLRTVYKNIISAFIELTGGVQLIYQTALPPSAKLFFIMTALSFGGISCIMQAGSFLEKLGLSLPSYIKHKLITTSILTVYYIIILSLLH
jgi:sporulation integral membrane protein YlbJ